MNEGKANQPITTTPHRYYYFAFYRLVVGMGLSRELYRRRIVDKMRLALYAWLYDDEADSTEVDEEEERSTKFREPVQMDTLEGLPMPGSERDDVSGILKEMVSPEWALTSNLHIALITLPFGSELVPAKSGGVEFYYVISGEGTYTRGDTVDKYNENTVTITTGSGFLVDPEVLRGFAAKGKGQVVLLRATDAAVMEGYDVLAGQSNSSSRALLGAGLGKIEEMYKKYSQNSDGYEILKTSGN
jgi:mannose-6-phosphate isomerase-like protein (cupin superfamily)